MPASKRAFNLSVPLDASALASDAGSQELRVAAKHSDGSVTSATVKVAAGEKRSAVLRFGTHPGPVQVIVGPASATAEDLVNLQTISVSVLAGAWRERAELEIDPVVIAPYWWWWWLEWCRTIMIRGQVVCADGSPVPGAQVCAYDVDWWWWWKSKQLLGCTTTAADGTFEIDFSWCCRWWPWWWWRLRVWEFEPALAAEITAVVEQDPRIMLGRSGTQPGLGVFSPLLGSRTSSGPRPLTPDTLDTVESTRTALLAKLPASSALAEARIWPWWPWAPWLDCTPDVIFKVTQDCAQPATVILDETYASARAIEDSTLSVTLTANDQACCVQACPVSPCVEGTCIDISNICNAAITDIGGNPYGDAGAATPAGLLDPGGSDRPFGGEVDISYANVMVGVDYYEILYSESGGPWTPLPAGAAMNFSRQWIQPAPPPTPWPVGSVPFAFADVVVGGATHSVVESKEHYEATTGLPVGAFWISNAWLVVPIDSTKFPVTDGVYPAATYSFTVVGWQESGGVYTPIGTWPTPLPVCDSEDPNGWTVTFNNRLDPDPAATTPCGAGTVTACVTQPTTQILSVTVGGVTADTCGSAAACGDLVIEFTVEDPTGYLDYFELDLIYGDDGDVTLVSSSGVIAGGTLEAVSADFAGPTYADAVAGGATRPTWLGGQMRLTVPASANVFPMIPCCYDLRLRAWTRTVVSCDGDDAYGNESDYTIGITACPPENIIVGREPGLGLDA